MPTWTREPADVARGDLLLVVDGVLVAQRIAAAERRTSASTDGGRRWTARHPEADVTAQGIESRKLAADVAYIRIPTFLSSDHEAWKGASAGERPGLLEEDIDAVRAAFASAVGFNAIVLDLRGNGGGTDLLGMEVAACLLRPDSVYYQLSSRGWFGWGKPSPQRLKVRGTHPRVVVRGRRDLA